MMYVCYYEFGYKLSESGDQVIPKEMVVEGVNIYDFKDGFWIDSEGRLSNQTSGKFWIPPSRIYYVEKVEKIEGD